MNTYGNTSFHNNGTLGFNTNFYQPPNLVFKTSRVVSNQKERFESDELFRKLSRDSEVRYTSYRSKPKEERRIRFINGCTEGRTEIAFLINGTNLDLHFSPERDCDYDSEPGKVNIKSVFIMNGVYVRWRGWIDLKTLDGVGHLEYYNN